MNFTREELTLMMLYSPGTRRGLITTLEGMREELTKPERRLRSLTDSVLDKLAQITDEEFNRLPLYPDLEL
ncbi:MAG: transposon-transfer assisting family protein [Oscillospiraceae bacterium]|nr:transposon-transfer assisting family protein [Oscillospiraceae bacterium]